MFFVCLISAINFTATGSFILRLHFQRQRFPPVEESLPVPCFLSGVELAPVSVSVDLSHVAQSTHPLNVEVVVTLWMLPRSVNQTMMLVCPRSDATTLTGFIHDLDRGGRHTSKRQEVDSGLPAPYHLVICLPSATP
jgi:hypothetical protein